MPSRRSLAEQQYYAHPRNAFWALMARMLGFDPDNCYEERCGALRAHGIALWDVIGACHRPGSMDADIDESTMEVNDFRAFFDSHKQVRAVFFNGQKAAQVYQSRVVPRWPDSAALALETLPSTSPANARMGLDAKYQHWRSALEPWLRSR